MSEPKLLGKSHDIPKKLVWSAWLKVKENGGAAGVDGVTIGQFEERLKDNLYRLWNRMSSGSYFPGPVRAVEIPKKGGTRVLGLPNVVDRVAQTVAVLALEPEVEKVFHDDSYGYRPGRSPLDAIAACRKRCWEKDWVVDLDVKAFFDTVSWDLTMKAVTRHTDRKWVLLYVERWLKAPMQMPDGTAIERTRGTPQGGPISPLLANLFLRYLEASLFEEPDPPAVGRDEGRDGDRRGVEGVQRHGVEPIDRTDHQLPLTSVVRGSDVDEMRAVRRDGDVAIEGANLERLRSRRDDFKPHRLQLRRRRTCQRPCGDCRDGCADDECRARDTSDPPLWYRRRVRAAVPGSPARRMRPSARAGRRRCRGPAASDPSPGTAQNRSNQPGVAAGSAFQAGSS